ncbi:MAG: hypothetical protein ISEC1_P1854 [Thiomicrorhabdus sp.]|nr:MAG: hypothetical protein ISEC1_P1854 [Thiomicrorhabdus sp.]
MTKQNFFKWFKRGTLVLAIIPILIFLAFAGAVNLIDFNQYKPQIEAEVKQFTGRDFKIDGDVEVSVLPFIFNVTNLYLKNPQGFSAENLLAIKELRLELSLSDLLMHSELSIISLELIEPKVHLVKMAQGDNWTDIKALNQAAESLTTLENQQLSQKPFSSGVDNKAYYWTFDSLVIRNGEVRLEDQVQDYSETLSMVNILIFDVVLGKPFHVNSDFIYTDSFSEKTNDFHLSGDLEIYNQFNAWLLTDWNGVFKLRLPEEKKVPEVRLTTAGDRLLLEFDTQDITVKHGQLKGLDADLRTNFTGKFGKDVSLEGSADVSNLNFENWAFYLGIAMPEFLDKTIQGEGNGLFDWKWDGKKLLLSPQTLEVKIKE